MFLFIVFALVIIVGLIGIVIGFAKLLKTDFIESLAMIFILIVVVMVFGGLLLRLLWVLWFLIF